MADHRLVKVFHSARQDLEIIWCWASSCRIPFFDTQVAAMVCGYGDSVSYEQLVNDWPSEDRQVVPLHRLVAPAALGRAARPTRSLT